jgi:hypothetical protein
MEVLNIPTQLVKALKILKFVGISLDERQNLKMQPFSSGLFQALMLGIN